MLESPDAGVSIIVRTEARRPALLRTALASLRAQTHRPLQVLLVEDGGATLAPLAEVGITGGWAGFEVRHLPIAKGGRCRAGNTGIAAAAMPYLGFLDDDDGLLPRHAAVLAATLGRHPAAPAAYGLAREVMCRPDGRAAMRPAGRAAVGVVPFSRARLWLGNFLPIQAVLMRRTAVLAAGGLDESLDALEDWDLWLRLAQAGDFVAVDEVTSWFRMPAGRCDRQTRAAAHARALAALEAHHAGLTAAFGFGDLRRLTALQAVERDELVGAGWCLGRLWRRLRDGR